VFVCCCCLIGLYYEDGGHCWPENSPFEYKCIEMLIAKAKELGVDYLFEGSIELLRHDDDLHGYTMGESCEVWDRARLEKEVPLIRAELFWGALYERNAGRISGEKHTHNTLSLLI
jgi:hypothetical protein